MAEKFNNEGEFLHAISNELTNLQAKFIKMDLKLKSRELDIFLEEYESSKLGLKDIINLLKQRKAEVSSL